MSNVVNHQEDYQNVLKKFQIPGLVDNTLAQGWDHVWLAFAKQLTVFTAHQQEERGLFVDVFCQYCLEKFAVKSSGDILLTIITQWYTHRQLPSRCGNMSLFSLRISYLWCIAMREKLHHYFLVTPMEQVAQVDSRQQMILLSIWRDVFLNSFSPLHLYVHAEQDMVSLREKFLLDCKGKHWYPSVIVASMYAPYSADCVAINVYKLWDLPSIPLWCKAILCTWLFATPYFNLTEQHRSKVLGFVKDFCQAAMDNPIYMSEVLFRILSEEIKVALWRVSYVGGNNAEEISIFGDFIHFYMNRMFPQFQLDKPRRRQKSEDKRLRIGYVSRLFSNQAVSFYMVNRLLCHDKTKFDAYTFAIDAGQNQMIDQVKKSSKKFIPIPTVKDFADIGALAETIANSKLDILIYPDIGMDAITYFLAGLQLAPIQCALVGHGTTTGLPTIQHYISGDFEPTHANLHYRENLIRLPNLGAAQLEPYQPEQWLTRKDFKIPEAAVVFVSCANGIKHDPARDKVLIAILQQAPNAVVVLKPFMNFANVDNHLYIRLKRAARQAGVEERLIVLPPLQQARDLLSLLAVSDVQLDTYPYGGWTTNMEALYMGLPIVTQEGRLARGRWGAAMLRAMNIQQGIARNEDEYIGWAVRYAQDETLRSKVREQIKAQVKDVLFNGTKAQACYEEHLTLLYNNSFVGNRS